MKMNDDKSHLLVLENKSVEETVNVSGSLVNESDEEKLLGVTIDKKLNFKMSYQLISRIATRISRRLKNFLENYGMGHF